MDASPSPRVLLAGDDGVAIRVREELELSGVVVVSLCSAADAPAAGAARDAGAALVLGDATEDDVWTRAGVEGATAIGVVGAGDLENLDAALLVAERVPATRLVVRTGSSDLRTGLQRLLGGAAEVISETEVAAPAFLRAALSGNEGQRVRLAGRLLEVAEVDRHDPRLVAALCDPDHATEVLPPVDALPALVLGLIDESAAVRAPRGTLPASVAARHRGAHAREVVAAPQRRPSPLRRLQLQLRLLPPRAWVLLAAIITVATISTLVFSLVHDLSFVNALYFTVTTMATVGYGDINLADEGAFIKVYDIGLMAVSAVLLASVLAVVTDVVVSSRIDRALGRFPRPHADHVVVCGLGRAGARILEGLRELGVPCIAVERDTEAIGVAVARDLQVPVVFADARNPEVLDRLHLDRALALMAVTSDDLANVQAGLAARDDREDLRVVMRIFDARLAERIDRSDAETLTRSVSALSAPAFSAALLGRSLAEPLAVSNLPLRVLSCDVPAGSPLVGRTVGALHAERELRVVALDGRYRPGPDAVVAAGAAISVVGTREACDALGAG